MSLLGLPTKELKQAAEHADKTLSNVDRTLAEVDATLREVRGIAEDLRALTAAFRDKLTARGAGQTEA